MTAFAESPTTDLRHGALTRDQLQRGTYALASPPGVFSQNATIYMTQLQLKI